MPKTARAASAVMAVSCDLPGTTKAIAWMGPRYSPMPSPGWKLGSHVVEKMSDSPTSTGAPPGPSVQGCDVPSDAKYAAHLALGPGFGSMSTWSLPEPKTDLTPVHEFVTSYTGVKPVPMTSGASLASRGGKLLEPVITTTCARPLVGSTQLGSTVPASPPSEAPPPLPLPPDDDPLGGGGDTSAASRSVAPLHSPRREQLSNAMHCA